MTQDGRGKDVGLCISYLLSPQRKIKIKIKKSTNVLHQIMSLAFSIPSFSPNGDGQEIDGMVLRSCDEISL